MEAYWGAQAQEQARGSISSDEGYYEGVVGGRVGLEYHSYQHIISGYFNSKICLVNYLLYL